MVFLNINERNRQQWLKNTLGALPAGWRIRAWPLAYAYALLGMLYFKLRAHRNAEDLASFGWHCVAVKEHEGLLVHAREDAIR